jgi:hypothetical protein
LLRSWWFGRRRCRRWRWRRSARQVVPWPNKHQCPSGSRFPTGLFSTYAYRLRLCGLSSFAYGTGSALALQSGDIKRPIALL